jgi:DNA ligase (NAD+)
MQYLTIIPSENEEAEKPFSGMTFVITGSLEHFANRDELKEQLISLGAKVAGSVSKNTTYLINNDAASSSSKNKKARELGIPILTEESLLKMINH